MQKSIVASPSTPPSAHKDLELPRRVLLVSEPGIDGVFRYVEALARYLISQGVNLDLVYSSIRQSVALFELIRFIEDRRGATMDLQVSSSPGSKDISAYRSLVRFVKEREPDVVHAHSSKAGALVRALRLAGVRTPLFYTPHAYYGMGKQAGLARLLFDGIEAALSRVGQTINVSATEARYGRVRLGVPPKRQLTVSNGVDCQTFCPTDSETRATLRARFNLPDRALVLGTVARYSFQKDPLTLHKAIRSVLPKYPDLFFVHVGKGQSLWDRVSAMGPHERILRVEAVEPVDAIYKMLDGFILPSRYEGLSLAVLEAAATNLPLILTHVVGNLDLEDVGFSDIYWSPPCDPDALVKAIEQWIRSYPHRPNHRALTRKLFSADVCHRRILHAYQLATGRQAGR